ncbi:MAG: ImmA/IrrE family metallo-endopeptidase [Verrucomicrobia bacterium]|nr:ImmA/IrrE family metallo-endopeptidase [Verrucomicrobiota bacterium]
MDQQILGKRLQKAREEAGLTQDAVERSLGLPKKSYTKIEAGLREVSTLELSRLAVLFHMSVADFFDEALFSDESPLLVLHRRAPGLEKNVASNEQVARCLQLCKEGAQLEQLLGIRRHAPIRYLFTTPKNSSEAIEQGERAAQEERRRLGVGNFPIYDIVEILHSQGIWAAGIHLPNDISGLFLHQASLGMAIFINATHARPRQRFSYVHEYAHALFDQKQRCVVSDTTNIMDLVEKRANAFAAAFLLPRDGIMEAIQKTGKGLSSRSSAAVYDVATDTVIEAESRQLVHKLTPQNVISIAHHFGVSYQATVYRLQSLKYISQDESEKLLKQENIAKEHVQFLQHYEPRIKMEEEPFLQRELILYIYQLVVEAYSQEKISRGRVLELCKQLSLPASKLLENM